MNRPHLIVTAEQRSKEEELVALLGRKSVPLDFTTPAQRSIMSAGELVKAMDCLHVQHAQFKERPRSLLPMPNLTGVNGHVIECTDYRVRALFKRFFAWAIR